MPPSAKAYGGSKTIEWFKVYAGDEACDLYGTYQYLPEDTLEAIPHLRRGHQRPPHHPRWVAASASLNVAPAADL
jgi:isocitrate dehydrogenase